MCTIHQVQSTILLIASLVAAAFLPGDVEAGCRWVSRGFKSYMKCTGDIAKATGDVSRETRKGLDHLTKESARGIENVGEAAAAIGKYTERQVRGLGDSLKENEKRIRQGKVVDALWHLGTDPVRYSEKNLAKATQESSLLRTVGQVSANVYGGPGGAAAYAAWYTYRQTGDKDLALRVGMITGATSAGFGAANKAIPNEELVKKTIVTGAIGGLAVAASGGDEKAIQEGFILSGGMVLVQDGYRRVTTHGLDAGASSGEAYCMATVGASCSPPEEAYVRDKNGNIAYEGEGNKRVPKVDVRKTDPRRPHVGNWSKATDKNWNHERGPFMTGVSKIPGMNAMSVFHDHWAVSWDMSNLASGATIGPAVVLTYIGTGAPVFDNIQEQASRKDKLSGAHAQLRTPHRFDEDARFRSEPNALTYENIEMVSGYSFACVNQSLRRSVFVDERDEPSDEFACRVFYQTEQGTTTPWTAVNDVKYCAPKALELTQKLVGLGWTCFAKRG